MSFSIWTQCAGNSEVQQLTTRPWRAVEAQHQVSTRKLVDSLEEQELLESILESHKPPLPPALGLHFLLVTPFRYPPLPHGSRFGTRAERGIWYGAESVRTMFAEVAYYRLLFIHGTEADLGVLELSLTAFRASVATDFGVDLTAGAFVPYRETIASRTAYAATQVLGGEMRAAGVRAFRYPSARDPAGGFCVGLFDPSAFKDKRPIRSETWYCFASRSGVELKRAGYSQRATYVFPLGLFLVDGELPQPAF